MKKLVIFVLFVFLSGCNTLMNNKEAYLDFNCPKVFFSSNNRNYIDTSDSLDEVRVRANLNNFDINKCQQKNNIVIIPLDILIIAEPLQSLEESNLSFPIYISLLDEDDNVLETQYFLVSSSIKRNPETNLFIETDISDRLNIVSNYLNTTQLVLGFMLDNKKIDLLN